MQNELQVATLPQELTQIAQNVSIEKRKEVQEVLNNVFDGVSKMSTQLASVTVTDENDKTSMKMANTIRLGVRKVRLEAEKTFDAKRAEVQAQMLSYKTEDQLWLKAKQTMQILTKEIEEQARWKEETKDRFEAEQKELKVQQRLVKVSKFSDGVQRSEVENLSDDSFNLLLSGLEKAYNDKVEAERKAEEERLRQQEVEKLTKKRLADIRPYYQFFQEGDVKLGELTEQDYQDLLTDLVSKKAEHDAKIEAQRVENERLKAEAAEKEKKLAEERKKAEAEKRALEEKARKEKEEADRKLKEAELARKKVEAELKAKADEEQRLKKLAEDKAVEELKLQQQAEEKAKFATDSVKLTTLAADIQNLKIPEVTSQDAQDILSTVKHLLDRAVSTITKNNA